MSHHDPAPVARFLEEADRRGLAMPGVFGVFYYRSANPRTLALLRDFIPVPESGLAREFADGATPDEVCARTIAAMMRARRPALLHQQPAAAPHARDARGYQGTPWLLGLGSLFLARPEKITKA